PGARRGQHSHSVGRRTGPTGQRNRLGRASAGYRAPVIEGLGMTRFCYFTLALAATFLAGCAVGPNYHTPDEHPPSEFGAVHGQTSMTSKASTPGPQAESVDYATWWRSLNDPELDSLVTRAVAANPDALIALDRLQAARTYEIAVVGAALPDVEASGGAGRGTGSDLTRSRAAQALR